MDYMSNIWHLFRVEVLEGDMNKLLLTPVATVIVFLTTVSVKADYRAYSLEQRASPGGWMSYIEDARENGYQHLKKFPNETVVIHEGTIGSFSTVETLDANNSTIDPQNDQATQRTTTVDNCPSKLDGDKLNNLPLNRLNKLCPSQLKRLSPDNLNRISAAQQCVLETVQLAKLSPDNVNDLCTPALNRLPKEQLAKLSPDNLNKLNASQRCLLEAAQLAKLSPENLNGLVCQ